MVNADERVCMCVCGERERGGEIERDRRRKGRDRELFILGGGKDLIM